MITPPSVEGWDVELFPFPFSEFRIYCRSTTGVDELYQPDEEPSQEIVVLADSTMLTRSLPADTMKRCIKSFTLYEKFKIVSNNS
jgi:hypothetical protein